MNRGNAIIDRYRVYCYSVWTTIQGKLRGYIFFLMCARHMTMNALPTIMVYQAESHITALHSYEYIVMYFQNRMHGVVLVKVNSVS